MHREEASVVIIKNAIRCNLCGGEIESRTVNEFVTCRCGACAVDGGHAYLRRCAANADCYTELSVTVPEPSEKTLKKVAEKLC